jgi:hypothetical protein
MRSFTKQDRPRSRRRLRSLAVVAVAGLVAVGTSAAVTSRATIAPSNNSAPSISGQTAAGSTLTANPGTWSGSTPLSFQYQWQICDSSGAGCHDISGATAQTYQVKSSDAGNTLKVHVIASNSDGSSSATSDATAKVGAAAAATSTAGCSKLAAGAQAVSVADVAAPARLQVAQSQLTSGPITSGMRSFSVRVQITDTCGNAVSGASVYATAAPYGQVTIPSETTTDASGFVTLTFNRLAGFPATRKQQLMVLFVRARRTGDPILAGISTRRLISLKVNLKK